MEYWTAFTIGLLGSMHCAGMCGPIAFALPLNRSNAFTRFTGSVLYNFGRLLTYALLGIILGLIGKSIAIAGFQQSLSIVIGTILVLSVLLPLLRIKKIPLPKFSLWLGSLKGEMGKRFGRQSNANLFTIGLLNGMLPCGLVYVAIAGASVTAQALSGGLFMLCFGLGTLPLMLSISAYSSSIQKKFLAPIRRFIPVFVLLMGTLLIIRGMDLGIPYLSPEIDSSTEIVKCH